jgi:hypothetical protein
MGSGRYLDNKDATDKWLRDKTRISPEEIWEYTADSKRNSISKLGMIFIFAGMLFLIFLFFSLTHIK